VQRVVDGKVDFVPVEAGFSADGYVSVTPRHGALAAGDMVVVGFQDRRRGRA
jgi:multidrug efflux pump subunit AcrA (membrane-fusion protein)